MLGQSAVPVFLFTVHGHVRHIGGNGHCGESPRGSPSCQRASRVPRARQNYAKMVGRSRVYVAWVGQGENRSRRGAGVSMPTIDTRQFTFSIYKLLCFFSSQEHPTLQSIEFWFCVLVSMFD
jgi:hypothetical protein